MTHGNKTILTRAVLLGLGLSSVVGGLALAADPLILNGNTKTVGVADGEKTTVSGSIIGVLAQPDPSASYSGVEMNDNELIVQNMNQDAGKGLTIGVYDMTDNTQNNPDGEFSSLTAENNKLTITGSTLGDTMQVDIYAPNAKSNNTIANNKAEISDTTINSGRSGGYFGIYQQYGSGNLNRTANEADFKNTTVNGWIMGSFFNNEVNDLTSQNNVISLTGSTVSRYLMQDYVYKGNQGEFTGNQILLDNSKVLAPIMGEAFNGISVDAKITAQNNNITLQNKSYAGSAVTVDDGNGGKGLTFGYTLGNNAASLTGSFTGKAGTKNGNVVLSTGNVDVDTVKFGQVTWGTTPLTLDPDVTYDFKDSKINTGSIAFTGLDGLSAGTNTMTLLDTNGRAINLSDGNLSGETLPYTVGTTLEGQGKAYLADGNVQYDIDLHDNTVKPQPQTHMTVIGQQAGLTSVLEGSDLVLRDLLTLKDKENGPFTFASVLGGENRYETGSSLRTNGWNGHAGFGWKKDFGTKGVGETALFYDYGDGNYRTYDGGLYGHGDLRYRGAGLLGRFTTPDKVFVEGSVRTGRVDNKARHVLVDGAGNGYDYDTDSRYTAFHVGAGRTVALNHRDSLEWYGRYFYTHVNGDDFEAGGRYHLDSVDSSLVRLGARWQRNSGKDAWYAGAAYEYEFDGDATGTADGRSIRSASLQGSSARLEAGMLWNKDNWTLQTGVHGYMGKHRGIGGTVDFVVHL